jgi:hypothetical protein
MTKISEAEFKRISEQIYADREQIYQFNVNAPHNEVLLWMLLSSLISYLSLTDEETPYFPGAPDAETYYQAILFVLKDRMSSKFIPEEYLQKLFTV